MATSTSLAQAHPLRAIPDGATASRTVERIDAMRTGATPMRGGCTGTFTEQSTNPQPESGATPGTLDARANTSSSIGRKSSIAITG